VDRHALEWICNDGAMLVEEYVDINTLRHDAERYLAGDNSAAMDLWQVLTLGAWMASKSGIPLPSLHVALGHYNSQGSG
jgi:hypothetical protein